MKMSIQSGNDWEIKWGCGAHWSQLTMQVLKSKYCWKIIREKKRNKKESKWGSGCLCKPVTVNTLVRDKTEEVLWHMNAFGWKLDHEVSLEWPTSRTKAKRSQTNQPINKNKHNSKKVLRWFFMIGKYYNTVACEIRHLQFMTQEICST